MTSAPGGRQSPPEKADLPAAGAEAVRADLAAIDERVFRATAAASLDDQLAVLRQVVLRILAADDV